MDNQDIDINNFQFFRNTQKENQFAALRYNTTWDKVLLFMISDWKITQTLSGKEYGEDRLKIVKFRISNVPDTAVKTDWKEIDFSTYFVNLRQIELIRQMKDALADK